MVRFPSYGIGFYYCFNSRLNVLKSLFRALLPRDNYTTTNMHPLWQKHRRHLFLQKFPGLMIIRLYQVLSRHSLTKHRWQHTALFLLEYVNGIKFIMCCDKNILHWKQQTFWYKCGKLSWPNAQHPMWSWRSLARLIIKRWSYTTRYQLSILYIYIYLIQPKWKVLETWDSSLHCVVVEALSLYKSLNEKLELHHRWSCDSCLSLGALWNSVQITEIFKLGDVKITIGQFSHPGGHIFTEKSTSRKDKIISS